LSERKDEKKQLAIIERKQDTAEKDRTAMAERLKEVEKNTADFNRWKERGVGALMRHLQIGKIRHATNR